MRHRASIVALPVSQTGPDSVVTFTRIELRALLEVYGRKVAAAEWRDYALDFERDFACFSVFRRSSDQPLFRIEKRPALARRQGAFAVIASDGRTFRRGHDIARVLRVFESRRGECQDRVLRFPDGARTAGTPRRSG